MVFFLMGLGLYIRKNIFVFIDIENTETNHVNPEKKIPLLINFSIFKWWQCYRTLQVKLRQWFALLHFNDLHDKNYWYYEQVSNDKNPKWDPSTTYAISNPQYLDFKPKWGLEIQKLSSEFLVLAKWLQEKFSISKTEK